MALLRVALGALTGVALGCAPIALPAVADDAEPRLPSGVTISQDLRELMASDDSIDVASDGTPLARDVWGEHDHPSDHTEHHSDGPGDTGDSDDSAAKATTARAAAAASLTVAETFALHSRPGSSRTIYLDFDGGTLLSSNTWLLEGLLTLLFPGWTLDASSAFSATELGTIHEVWARVAEDFAPWDVDVTTAEPPAGALWRSSSTDATYGTRVAFTSGTLIQQQLCRGSCGGIAWIGTFDSTTTSGETRSPAWVFPSSLGNKAKSLAEAASHEVGHNLGLHHDGVGTSSYYAGGQLWGPLMGSPYGSSITQWSRGDYANATNDEDDLVVMGANGIARRPDEAGDTVDTAAGLASLSGGHGVISRPDDEDWIEITSCSGTMTAQALPATHGPNLDVRLGLRDAAGNEIASHAPLTTRTNGVVTGQSASLTRPLTGGPYYLTVSGTGSGAGGTAGWTVGGFDDYGSLGAYTVQMSGCDGGSSQPPLLLDPESPTSTPPASPPVTRPGAPGAAVVKPGRRGGRSTVAIRWGIVDAGGGAVTGYRVRAYRVDGGRATATTRVLSAGTAGVDLRLPAGRWVVRIKVRNNAGWSAYGEKSRVVRPR